MWSGSRLTSGNPDEMALQWAKHSAITLVPLRHTITSLEYRLPYEAVDRQHDTMEWC